MVFAYNSLELCSPMQQCLDCVCVGVCVYFLLLIACLWIALAARLRGNKEAMAGLAVQEIVLEGSVVQRPGCDPTQLLMPEKVRLAELPVYRDSKFCQHTQVEQGAYGDFTLLQQQPYKVRAQKAGA